MSTAAMSAPGPPCGAQPCAREGLLLGEAERPTLRKELRIIITTGLPLAFSSAARLLQDLTNTVMLGRFSTAALGGVAIAGIWTGIMDTMLFSVAGQFSALCSQAYGGGNLPLVGIWLQIFLVFVTICSLPLLVLRCFTSPVLQALGISAELSDIAGIYTFWGMFGVVFDLWYVSLKEYYASQLIVYPDAIIDAVFILINIVLNYGFIYGLGWGVRGAAISTSVTRLCRTLCYALYCRWRGYHRQTWRGWSWKEIAVWPRWKALLKLAAPAAVGGLAEEAQFAFCTLLIGRFGPADSAAWSLMLNLLFLALMFSMSMGEATGIRMAHFLGDGQPDAGRFVSRVGIGFSVCWGLFAGVVAKVGLQPLSYVVTYDSAVREVLDSLHWMTAASIGLMGILMPLITVLLKQGRGQVVSIVIPVCCWLVGCPFSWFLSRSQGVSGVSMGLVLGYGLATVSMAAAYLKSDWPLLAEKARQNAELEPAAGTQATGCESLEAGPGPGRERELTRVACS